MEKHFIFGYGSLINKSSRQLSSPSSFKAIPVKVKKFTRGWFARTGVKGLSTTYLGCLKNDSNILMDNEKSSFINGVIYEVDKEELLILDKREKRYARKIIELKDIEAYDVGLAEDMVVWIYTNEFSSREEFEKSLPNANYPITQSYVDLCISGCYEIEAEFTEAKNQKFSEQFITSTTHWNKYWVNDRIYPRRPHVYCPHAFEIDEQLAELYPRRSISIHIHRIMKIRHHGHWVNIVIAIFTGLVILLFNTEVHNNSILLTCLIIGIIIFAALLVLLLKFCSEKKEENTAVVDKATIEQENIEDLAINTDGVFEGRDDEIEKILELLEKAPIVTIKGSPGLGKSTLAQYLIKDVKTKRKFKGFCYVKLENSESAENDDKSSKEYIAEQILRSFMEAYNHEVSYITQVETRLKKMTDTLVVLDNTEQIDDTDLNDTIVFWSQNLNTNIRFVLTSRRKHKGIKCVFELEPLIIRKDLGDEKTEACIVLIKKLKLKRNGWEYDDTKENNLALFEITNKTEGVPWCIDAVSGIFKSKNYSLSELAKSIESIVTPKDDLYKTTESFFDRSYLEMHPEVQKIFIQTCIFDGDFELKDFYNVVNSESDKDNLIDELKNHSFLRDLGNGYFSLYVHVREFGGKKLKLLEKSEYKTLNERFYNHYLSSIKTSSKENIRKQIGNYIKAQELLIKELKVNKAADLTLSLDKAIEASGSSGIREKIIKISYHPFSNESNQTKVKLGLRLSEIYFASGAWLKAESYAKKSIYYSENNSLLKARSLLKLGKIYKEKGFLHESIRLFRDCSVILDNIVLDEDSIYDEYISDKLNVLDQLGRLNEFNSMIEQLNYDKRSDEMARIYNRIGLKEWHHSNIQESIEAFEKAISIAKNSKSETWEAAFTTNKALAQIDISNFNEALHSFNDNIGTHRISGRKAWEAVTYGGKGSALLRRNNKEMADYVVAEANLLKAIKISEELGYPENLTWLKGELARFYLIEDFDEKYSIDKSYDLIKEALHLHKKMGCIRNVRYFSNYITLLKILEKQTLVTDSIEFIETLYVLFDLVKNYIVIHIKTPTESLQADIEYLDKIILKYCGKDISALEQTSISQVLGNLNETNSLEKEINIIKHNIANQKEGSYEYYASKDKNQWKYFEAPKTLEIFVYGIMLNSDFLKFYSPLANPLPAKSFGFRKKYNHVLPESIDYPENRVFAKGDITFNMDYTGFCSDESHGLLIKIDQEGFSKLENYEKGFALRPITYQLLNNDNDNTIGKAYTLTSTNRVYMKQELTNGQSEKNKEYLKLCEDGAKSYGDEFYKLWKDY